MSEKLITSRKLAVTIGISPTTMNTYLGNFNKYLVQDGGRYYYKYNYYFLRDLKKFFDKKLYHCSCTNFERFNNAITILEKLMDEMK